MQPIIDDDSSIDVVGILFVLRVNASVGGGVRLVATFAMGLLVASLGLNAGCSRTRYRLAADRDSYAVLAEKSAAAPWAPPCDFNLQPLPHSRLYDPTPLDDPLLPMPAPQLYAYNLPPLRSLRDRPAVPGGEPEVLPGAVTPAGYSVTGLLRLPQVPVAAVRQVAFDQNDPPPAHSPPANSPPAGANETTGEAGQLTVVPVPAAAWEAMPTSCLVRMFEFDSVRNEYRRTHQADVDPQRRDTSPQLTLRDIVDLGLLNSREYQTQKETLYRAALRLTLERFSYELKPSSRNNGTASTYTHDRNLGVTENGLAVPTALQTDRMLNTSGDLLARFANSVVLTFNGPSGFAADVGSELFFDLSQSVFQRDVRFESLTQAERNVVYAARDFARFRKQFFVTLATQYYGLLRTYRQIEIETQNYFTLVRAFGQRESEYRAGLAPRIQVDQVEQDVLRGRSRLIGTCKSLEDALDTLKIRMGLPTESPLNLDLGELQQLTQRDRLSVTNELVRRVHHRLTRELRSPQPNRVVVISSAIVLSERLLDAAGQRAHLDVDAPDVDKLTMLRARLRVDAARDLARAEAEEFAAEQRETQRPAPLIVFQRTMDLLDSEFALVDRQLELATLLHGDAVRVNAARDQRRSRHDQAQRLQQTLSQLIETGQLAQVDGVVIEATRMMAEAKGVTQGLDQWLAELDPQGARPEDAQRATLLAETLLELTQASLSQSGTGLTPIDLDTDDAMLTALVQRFDLLNQRESLADDWRQIKLAGDDLKSILNLRATQSIRTRQDVNRAFDFTLDDSTTRLSATFDAPLNRRAQRNTFRATLIDYQASLRQLMALEDTIKQDVRNTLRELALDQEQFRIDVASSALAFERVVSTELELRLGVGNVAARDFLEAQNAYISALSNVAGRHIDYILDRTQLFLSLESLTVDETGFWDGLYDERLQIEPYYQLPPYALPPYGYRPPHVHHSREIRRQDFVPPGSANIHRDLEAIHSTAPPTLEPPPALEPPSAP